MSFFEELSGTVLLKGNGIYREAQLLKRSGTNDLFARYSGGAIRLLANNATSVAKLSWMEIDTKLPWHVSACYLQLIEDELSTQRRAA